MGVFLDSVCQASMRRVTLGFHLCSFEVFRSFLSTYGQEHELRKYVQNPMNAMFLFKKSTCVDIAMTHKAIGGEKYIDGAPNKLFPTIISN